MQDKKLGFLGAGQMARALANGFVSAGLVSGEQIHAADVYPAACEGFVEQVPGATTGADNTAVVTACNVIFLAVKPQNMAAVLEGVGMAVTADQLFVSIAAGVTIDQLSKGLGGRVIRVMPNTPCLVGKGASAFARGPSATDADAKLVKDLLSAVGFATELAESHLDAVTGLSGSGPAFVYQIIEAMSDAGVRMGLPRDVATQLAASTVQGAAEMVLETGEHPAVLKDRVASPGGTTIAGLQALEQGGLRSALISAVEAATRRSQELGS